MLHLQELYTNVLVFNTENGVHTEQNKAFMSRYLLQKEGC